MVQGGTNGSAIFNLPPGFRPPMTVETVAYQYVGAIGLAQVYVQAGGNIIVNNAASNANYVSLVQVRYSVTP